MSDIKIAGAPNIAFFGPCGAGKTTAAKLLEEFGYERAAIFGEHPGGGRDIAKRIWPGDDTVLQDRERLQALGKLVRIDEEVWIRNYMRWIDRRSKLHQRTRSLSAGGTVEIPLPPLCNDGCRSVVEYQTLVGAGWVMVRVVATEREPGEPEDLWEQRDLAVRRDRLQTSGKYQTEDQLHDPLEHHLDGFRGDYTIINDGTLEELGDEILNIVLRERRRS